MTSPLPSRRPAPPPHVATLVLALAIAACSTPDAPAAIDPDVARAEAALLEAGAMVDAEVGVPRVFPQQGAGREAAADAAGDSVSAAVTLPITYHGGPIMPSARVVSIYWSANPIYQYGPTPGTIGPGTSDNSLIGYFLRNLGNSAWWNINTRYYDVTNGTVRHVAAVIPYSRFWAANILVPSFASSVPDAAVRQIVKTGIVLGKIPFDDNAIYTVFGASSVNLGGGFVPGGYCAYHNWFNFTWGGKTLRLKYAVMPVASALAGCRGLNQLASPNNDYSADIEINPLAHELAEAATDPALNAWFDAADQENADKCQWTYGTTFTTPNGAKANLVLGSRNFLVQQNWALGTGLVQKGCSMRM